MKELGFRNINADLIFGLPEQTIEDVKKDVEEILRLDLQHVSIYSLILEEGTKLHDLVGAQSISDRADMESAPTVLSSIALRRHI